MIKQVLLSLALIVCYLLISPVSAQARNILSSSAGCIPGDETSSSAVCATTANSSSGSGNPNPAVNTLNKATDIIAFVAGAAGVIVLLVGSIQYITSDGDSNKISGARNTIIYALIGLLIVALTATIVEFVVNKL